MKYEIMQGISQIIVVIGIILTGIGGFGAYYYGKKTDNVKETQNIIKEKELNSKIDTLVVSNQILNEQLKPIDELIKKYYPDEDKREAIERITSEIEKIKKKTQQIETKIQDRHLTTQQKNELLKNLTNFKSHKIHITTIMGDSESFQFASEIKELFIQAGWNVEGVTRVVYVSTIYGIRSGVKSNPPSELVYKFINLLLNSKLEVKVIIESKWGEEELNLIIGKKE